MYTKVRIKVLENDSRGHRSARAVDVIVPGTPTAAAGQVALRQFRADNPRARATVGHIQGADVSEWPTQEAPETSPAINSPKKRAKKPVEGLDDNEAR